MRRSFSSARRATFRCFCRSFFIRFIFSAFSIHFRFCVLEDDTTKEPPAPPPQVVCISCFRRCLSRAIAAWLYCDCDRGGLLDCAFEEARRREGAVPRAESKAGAAGAVDAH